MVALHQDPARAMAIGAEAHKLVQANYSDGPIVTELVSFYKRLLKG